MANPTFAHLLPIRYKRQISEWLEEDCPAFDVGGFVVGERPGEARLLGKSAVRPSDPLGFLGIVAGVPFFDEVFRQLDCTVEWQVAEGSTITPITQCAIVRGPTRLILLGERVALNTLARCSGIATKSASLLRLLRSAGYPETSILAGTRKTTPGFRIVEKYGMLIGGCDMHRYDLSHMIMLKDNHVHASTSIPEAIARAKTAGGFSTKVEVEVASLAEAQEAAKAGADIVMLDNFSPDEVRYAAKSLKDEWGSKVLVEVSGGLTEENVRDFVCPGLDIISTSAIHQSTQHVDFSLKIMVQ